MVIIVQLSYFEGDSLLTTFVRFIVRHASWRDSYGYVPGPRGERSTRWCYKFQAVLPRLSNVSSPYIEGETGPSLTLISDADGLLGVDAAWESYLEACIAAGDKCALSHLNSTASDLANTLSRTADRYRTPVTVGSDTITYSTVKTIYYIVLQSPERASKMTTLLNNLVTGEDLADVVEYFASLDEEGGNEAEWGIACGDTIPRAVDAEGVMDEVDYLMESSPEFGGLAPEFSLICARWPFSAKEVKTVNKEVETRKPVLFVGNTYDPATPVHSAYNMSKLFPGSVVVEQNGYGVSHFRYISQGEWKWPILTSGVCSTARSRNRRLALGST